jgi:hypothetical protein
MPVVLLDVSAPSLAFKMYAEVLELLIEHPLIGATP